MLCRVSLNSHLSLNSNLVDDNIVVVFSIGKYHVHEARIQDEILFVETSCDWSAAWC